jgi:DNA-binding XRE family transcriptional regulator
LLKAKREALARGEYGREAFAEKIGVAKSTVQHAEMGPDVPQIDTCAKLIEGTGSTLSEFFLELETPDRSDLITAQKERKDPQSNPAEAVAHAAPVPAVIIDLALIQRTILESVDNLAAVIERVGDRVAASQQRSPGVGANAPVRRSRPGRVRSKTG